jgi:hypothetical protein
MRQILIGIVVLVLAALAAGCQTSIPPYQFSCANQHAIDAGLCELPGGGRLVGGVLHQDYSEWRY